MKELSSEIYFDKVSTQWDEMGNSYFGDAPRKAIFDAVKIPVDSTVVDVGCGTGYLIEGLDLAQVKAIAIDQSRDMLNEVKKKFGESAQIDYRVGNAEALPVESGTTDVVVANMYLHHVEHPDLAIAEMVRILRPGGQLAFTDMDKHNHEFLITEQHDRWMGFERRDITAWMENAGLKDVIVDCIGTNCCAESCGGEEKAEISVFIAKGVKL